MSGSASLDLPAELVRTRLRSLRDTAAERGVAGLALTPGSELRYLTGLGGDSFERLTALAVRADSERAALVVPAVEAPAYDEAGLAEVGVELLRWRDGENPHRMLTDRLPTGAPIAVADGMPALHSLQLRDAGLDQQRLAGHVVRELRMRKTPEELASLTEAGAAIDRVHARMHEFLKPGRTEAAVGADIAEAMVAEGHSHPDFIIVGSGPNGASPHHDVSEKVIEPGEIVVVDIGGPTPSGYNSDCTRTYSMGAPADNDVAEIYAVLHRAQAAAVAAVRPGVTAAQIDAAARDVIAAAGYGEQFIHRTGHGIGLDVHEEPYIGRENELALEPGMAFSIEPGIYFEGRWGARIEDIVTVTDAGVRSLNNQPRQLTELPA